MAETVAMFEVLTLMAKFGPAFARHEMVLSLLLTMEVEPEPLDEISNNPNTQLPEKVLFQFLQTVGNTPGIW